MEKQKMIVSLVGAGGKTTIMYDIAQLHVEKNEKVILTTSRLAFHPSEAKLERHYAASIEEVEQKWSEHQYAVVGNQNSDGSVSCLTPSTFILLSEMADYTLIEADVSNGMSCKVPSEEEPYIHPRSNCVVAVFGVRAFGKKLKNCCMNAEIAAKHLGVTTDHILGCEDIVAILTSEWGSRKDVGDRKYIIVLNQCDGAIEMKGALKIVQELGKLGFYDVYMTHKGQLINTFGNMKIREMFF